MILSILLLLATAIQVQPAPDIAIKLSYESPIDLGTEVLRGQPLKLSVSLVNRSARAAARAHDRDQYAERGRLARDGVFPEKLRLQHKPSDIAYFPQGRWVHFVKLEMLRRHADGSETTVLDPDAMMGLTTSAGSVLAPETGLSTELLYWNPTLPPDVMSGLVDGEYVIRARFDTLADSEEACWKGAVEAPSLLVQLRSPSTESETAHVLLAAGWYFLSIGEPVVALDLASQLSESPSIRNYGPLLLAARANELLGNPEEALRLKTEYLDKAQISPHMRRSLVER
jgi:hypothetical protein